ncbi:MAG: hypothetical protein MUC43_05395 [Pirellula sp.]|jgi:hypothetical protein|nr:hypothetical protein [Pirellula sp.]
MDTEHGQTGSWDQSALSDDFGGRNATDSNHDSMTNSLEIAEQIQRELAVFEPELPNIALDEEELATLNDLIERYDRVIHELDLLNDQIENLLAEESIKGCDS